MNLTSKLRWIGIFLLTFTIGNFLYLNLQINGMNYDAKVVNFAGIVRGGTQRLVKLEINRKPADALMNRLQSIITGLAKGDEKLGLPGQTDKDFLSRMAAIQKDFDEIKKEIAAYRSQADAKPDTLMTLSEGFFEQTNSMVSAAEAIASTKVTWFKSMQIILFVVSLAMIAGFFFIILKMTQKLRFAIQLLKQSSLQMIVTTENVATVSNALSTNATESAASFEEITSSIESLSNVVASSAEKARAAKKQSQSSQETATHTEIEIKKLISAVDEIAQGSKKIREIITVMDEIAFQTNLLSLNASVEAARAGQYGRGFAVVAEAVRQLAMKSGNAAKDVSGLINETVNKTDVGATIAKTSRNALESTVKSIQTISGHISDLTQASEEQASNISEISKAMSGADVINQQNAAKAEQAAAASSELTKQGKTLEALSQQLVEIVGLDNIDYKKTFHTNSSGIQKPQIARSVKEAA